MKQKDVDDQKLKPTSQEMMMCAQLLAGIADDANVTLTVTLKNFSVHGDIKGDYEVTVRKMEDGEFEKDSD